MAISNERIREIYLNEVEAKFGDKGHGLVKKLRGMSESFIEGLKGGEPESEDETRERAGSYLRDVEEVHGA